jgi:hypothetical protein
MYTTMRTYSIRPGSWPELKRRFQTYVKPRISGLPGFVASYLLEVSADQVTSVSVFDSKGHADLASGPIGFWMRDALGDAVLGLPEIISGQSEVSRSGGARSRHSDRQQVLMEPWKGII